MIAEGTSEGPGARPAGSGLRQVPTPELIRQLARTAGELARKEVALARAELRADLRTQARAALAVGVAVLCAFFGAQLLVAAAALGLVAAGLPGWAAALAVAAVVLIAGAAVGLRGWARRVRVPLGATRRSFREAGRWATGRAT